VVDGYGVCVTFYRTVSGSTAAPSPSLTVYRTVRGRRRPPSTGADCANGTGFR